MGGRGEGAGDRPGPAGPPEEGEASGVDDLVAAIQDGRDDIPVPRVLTGADVADPTEDPFRSFITRVRFMSVAERIKLALRGNKEVRVVLLRDTNKVVARLVLQNPRLSEDEVVSLCHNRNTDEEILRQVAARREWTKNYQVRLGLVSNPKTPTPLALRFLATISEKDMQRLAKSKNVPDAVATAARRTIVSRQLR